MIPPETCYMQCCHSFLAVSVNPFLELYRCEVPLFLLSSGEVEYRFTQIVVVIETNKMKD